MRKGYLSQYFKGVAAKILSAVEIDTSTSNQHELNGVVQLKKILGSDRQCFAAQFIYVNDTDDEPIIDTGFLTWYDAREFHPTRSEYRLYFPATRVTICAEIGDILFIARRPDDTVLFIVAEYGSTISNQLLWLFGVPESSKFSIREDLSSERDKIALSTAFILDYLNIPVELSEERYLEEMLSMFNGKFPTGNVFSSYARSTLSKYKSSDDPDTVIVDWMEREELLFRTLEKHIVSNRLKQGFSDDVDEFFKFSLSVQNRRKSRAGQAFENHVEQIFISRGLKYDRTKITENKARPDFIFPGIKEYHDSNFEKINLTMLGVKSTCKDRWRQVISEADRISPKHLLTLEAAISSNQLLEMSSQKVQIVIPKSIHETYNESLRSRLMNLSEFIELVENKQRSITWNK